MRIAVDARELSGRPTGVGTYLGNLLREWQAMPSAAAHEWHLYAPNRADGVGSLFHWRTVPGHPGTWWEQRALADAIRHDRPNVLFAPGYSAPLTVRVPVVLAIHDVSFFAHPEWFRWREGVRRRLVTGRSARKAHAILTISQFSREEIVQSIGVPAERVEVIYPGVAPATEPADAAAREPVVLYVGSIFNRRRVPDLIRAFAAVTVQVPGARLEIVGDNRTHPHEDLAMLAASLGVSNSVRLRSYVSAAELDALYRRARAFAFLSEYEGFGFTPLEALARGVPAVVLDTPVAREVYRDAVLYVLPGDIGGTAAELRRLLKDAALRTELVTNGRRVLGRYSWHDAAVKTLQALERAAR